MQRLTCHTGCCFYDGMFSIFSVSALFMNMMCIINSLKCRIKFIPIDVGVAGVIACLFNFIAEFHLLWTS